MFVTILLSLLSAFSLVQGDRTARIVVDPKENASVVLAAEDLRSDVRKITGKELRIVRSSRPKKGDVYISTVEDGRWEAYDVSASDGIMRVKGSDRRGTIFAIYDFCENYLGVDPLYWWNDAQLPSSDVLSWESVEIHADEPDFRYRGFFVNDEDLICSWKEPSGRRNTGYKYYENVPSLEVVDRIMEAVVRNRMNLIIPATLTNLFNAPEKALLDVCAKRGIFMSQHHIEPLGVSSYTYDLYWKNKTGEIPLYSYYTNPDKLEEVWRESAKLWAQYPDVLWQIGLKGYADHAIWVHDPSIPESDSLRADIISRAMEAQVRILDEIGVPKEGRVMTNTLWADAAAFNSMGYLRIPEDAVVVFSDNCPGWRWTDDFRNTERKEGRQYGVYYHPAVMISGPHLASLVPVTKTYELMSQAREKGSDEYIVFNVATIREICYNLDAGCKMVWDMDSFSPEKWQQDWVKKHYSRDTQDWTSAYNIHYNSTQMHPVSGMPIFFDGQMVRRIKAMNELLSKMLKEDSGAGKVPAEGLHPDYSVHVADTWMRSVATVMGLEVLPLRETYLRLSAQEASFEISMETAEQLYARLPEAERQFAFSSLVYPTTFMYYVSGWLKNMIHAQYMLETGDRARAKKLIEEAVAVSERLRSLTQEYCSGRWSDWYNDCCKLHIYREMAGTAALLKEF